MLSVLPSSHSHPKRLFRRKSTKTSQKTPKATLKADFSSFVERYPDYAQTTALDRLRDVEFARLDGSKEVYVDYMGGCLWPKSLVTNHADLLKTGLFGNTHSDSPCATRSDHHIAAARAAVLDFFDAPSSDYACIFTANATGALKLVGESFPFGPSSQLVIPADCHNSVNGIRRFAENAGSKVHYLGSTPHGGFDEAEALTILRSPGNSSSTPSLFIVTGQSNITGIRPSLSVLADAKAAGFSTLIDAAALASSVRISLQQTPNADAMVVSFYKMFGYPTGVGALVAKKSFLATLERRWFSGGSVDFVQAPGKLTLHAKDVTARFEEGTLNYSSLSAIAPGLQFLTTYMPYMMLRLPSLHHYLHTALETLVYPGTQTPLVRVHTRLRDMPLSRSITTASKESTESTSKRSGSPLQWAKLASSSRTSSFLGALNRRFSSPLPSPPLSPSSPRSESSLEAVTRGKGTPGQGYVVSCTFYRSTGEVIPLSHVSKLASIAGISLRTGCVCNPGGSAALRGQVIQERMEELSKFDEETVELKQICQLVGGLSSAGVVRLSLGMASNFEDVWRVVQWARTLLDEAERDKRIQDLLK
ncbi:related to molybdenum cofactor sulfurase [Serendipita indica DSM 11827]|uniref:Related to molybdenum cofactor sulfurase n=1 Tax=Serendipita indica (strain DSM 11827) TaxID=1109443 RepID=G4T9U5_SERID|nr:related to molybdenum cofactor sulfurase [Serendipita indica DSM 11827]